MGLFTCNVQTLDVVAYPLFLKGLSLKWFENAVFCMLLLNPQPDIKSDTILILRPFPGLAVKLSQC